MQNSKLYVGNLNYSVTEEQLKELFENHGAVESVKIIGERGFGFVEMSTPEEAAQAMEALNETVFQERTLRVDKARPPKPRDYGDEFGNSGGYGGGRGRRDNRGGGRGGGRGRGNSGRRY
jgi:RNA recognition motif-containing protein